MSCNDGKYYEYNNGPFYTTYDEKHPFNFEKMEMFSGEHSYIDIETRLGERNNNKPLMDTLDDFEEITSERL